MPKDCMENCWVSYCGDQRLKLNIILPRLPSKNLGCSRTISKDTPQQIKKWITLSKYNGSCCQSITAVCLKNSQSTEPIECFVLLFLSRNFQNNNKLLRISL